MYKYILFDLDGTLTDPGIGITNSVSYALKKYGIETKERSSLYKFIGPPLKDSFMKYYGFSEKEAVTAIEYYREYFSQKGIFENKLYDRAENLLCELKKSGKVIILATSKPQKFSEQILEYFGITKYFDCVVGATMDGSLSYKKDIISLALKKCEITDLSACVMVGDRAQDVSGAVYNKIDSIGVLYGYGDKEELISVGATYLAESPGRVLEILS